MKLHPVRRDHQHQLRPAPQVLDIAEDEAQQCGRGGVFEAILIRDGYDGARVPLRPGMKAAERVCLLLITGATPESLTVQSVTHLEPTAVKEAKYFIRKMRTLGMRAKYGGSDAVKRMSEWATTPDSAKKCKKLEAHPTGDSL